MVTLCFSGWQTFSDLDLNTGAPVMEFKKRLEALTGKADKGGGFVPQEDEGDKKYFLFLVLVTMTSFWR